MGILAVSVLVNNWRLEMKILNVFAIVMFTFILTVVVQDTMIERQAEEERNILKENARLEEELKLTEEHLEKMKNTRDVWKQKYLTATLQVSRLSLEINQLKEDTISNRIGGTIHEIVERWRR
jgi:hypothetical protein